MRASDDWCETITGISLPEARHFRSVSVNAPGITRTWERWLKLVGQQPDDGLAGRRIAAREKAIERGVRLTPAQERKLERPPRDSQRDWPPKAASFDGIEGKAMRTYGVGWLVRRYAEPDLAEVERFRKEDPAAARSIAAPLREYG